VNMEGKMVSKGVCRPQFRTLSIYHDGWSFVHRPECYGIGD
jgi:hypothetical protein